MHTLHMTSPHMHGAKSLQGHVNAHLKAWGAHPNHLLKLDDEFGPLTRKRTLQVAYGLGLQHSLVEHGITVAAQRKIANSSAMTPAEHHRMNGRKAWRHRYIWRLNGGHEGAAVAFAKHMARLHITEYPAGSNLGPYITNWEIMAGYNVRHASQGVFWCGCFVNACLVGGGLPSQMWGIGYVPTIEAHAQSGHDGWVWHPASTTPQRGWIPTFGAAIGEHTEFVVEDGWPLRTVGGNTSEGNGSPNNGGGVYAHNFAHYNGLPLRGFAAPNYQQ